MISLNVLLVEDEPKVQKFVRKALEQSGMLVTSLDNLDDVESYLEQTTYDVLILDRLIGQRDSLSLLTKFRKSAPQTKILILSALGELDDRVSGLNLGADDYLPKPFHVAELLARVQSLSRRSAGTVDIKNKLKYEDVDVILETQEVFRAGKNISLTSKEFKLLTLLMQKPLKVFSKMELLDRVWGMNWDPESNVVEVTVNRLRAKVDADSKMQLIHTRRGSGYWFGISKADP